MSNLKSQKDGCFQVSIIIISSMLFAMIVKYFLVKFVICGLLCSGLVLAYGFLINSDIFLIPLG